MSETNSEPVVRGKARTLPLDLVFDLLANRHRRLVLYRLYTARDDAATVRELVEFIHVHEHEDSDTNIHLSLTHTHLPKLVAAGIVEYDQRSDTVRYWSHPCIEEWLEHAHHLELETPA